MSEPRTTTPAGLRARFDELAERYETAAALDPSATPAPGRAPTGPRLPPGAQEVLDDDEVTRAVDAVDGWAEFLAHVLADERDVAARNPSTPARLRFAGEHADLWIVDEDAPDTFDFGLLALSVQDDLGDHLAALRRIAARQVRHVRTGHRCHTGCGGQYVSPLGTGDRHEDALRCERCGHEVSHDVWSRWPRARVKFVSPEHAAKMAGVSLAAVWQRAKRQGWRRIGTGRDVRYSVEDIRRDTSPELDTAG